MSKTLPRYWMVFLGFSSVFTLSTYSLVTSTDVYPNVSISSLLTTVVAVITPMLLFLQIRTDSIRQLWFLAPWVTLVLVQGVSLLFHMSLPGAQNFVGLLAFVSVLIFAASYRYLDQQYLDRFVGIAILHAILVSIFVTVYYLIFDRAVPDVRSLAMTYVIALALALGWRPVKGFYALVPGIIWLAIAVTGSRTATAVGAMLIVLSLLQGFRTHPWRAIARSVLASILVAGLYLAIVRMEASVREVWKAGDNGIQIPIPLETGNPGAVTINSNGRVEVWASLVAQLDGLEDWLLGKGTGFSAEFTRANYSFFVQSLNEYVRFLVDNGIFGITLFLAGIGTLVFASIRFTSTSWGLKFAVAPVLAFALIALSEPSAIYIFFSLPIALVAGFALNQCGSIIPDSHNTPPRRPYVDEET